MNIEGKPLPLLNPARFLDAWKMGPDHIAITISDEDGACVGGVLLTVEQWIDLNAYIATQF